MPLGYSLVAGAATKNWIAGSGAWTASGNWSPSGVPVAGDVANLFNSGGVGNDALIAFDNYSSGTLSSLTIDATNGGSITLQQNSGYLYANNEILAANGIASLDLTGGSHVSSSFYAGGSPFGSGYGGRAQINQSGGLLSAQNGISLGFGVNSDVTMIQSGGTVGGGGIAIAGGVNSHASYTLNGPQAIITINGSLNVGGGGDGVFNLVQGQFTSSGAAISVGVGGSGTMNLSGGVFTVSQYGYVTTVGGAGRGAINQSGGIAAYQSLAIAAPVTAAVTPAPGTYNLSAGTMSSTSLSVGGTFNQTGGSYTCYGPMTFGAAGTFNLSGGTFTEASPYGPWTIAATGIGTFNQTNGITTAGTLLLGTSTAQPGNTASPFAFGTGRVNLSGGVMTLGNEEVGSHGTGEFVQTGGSHAVSSLIVGGTAFPESTARPVGSYALSGGTLQATVEQIGFNTGTGTFTQTGGTHLVTGSLTLGTNSAGTYSLSGDGSTLSVGGDERIGGAGVATFLQSGGTHSVGGQLTVGGSGTGAASFTLQGGSLAAGSVLVSPGGTFIGAGGTLTTNAFTLAGGAVTGTLRNVGNFTYQAGSFAAQLINAGTFNLQGGTVSASAVQVNAAGGAINGWGRIDGPLNNVGSLNATGSLLLGGSVTNAGAINAPAGSSLITPCPVLNTGGTTLLGGALLAGDVVTNAGVVTLSGGGGISASGDAGQFVNAPGGTLQGGGNVALPLVNRGTICANDAHSPLTLANLPANATGAQLQVGAGSTLSLSTPLNNLGTFRLLGTGAQATGATITNDGALRGAGQVNNTVQNKGVLRAENGELDLTAIDNTNTPAGHIQVSSGNAVVYLLGLPENAGTIELSGGSFDNNGASLTNSGSILGNGALRTGGLLNNGAVTFADVASSVYGPVTNTGSLNLTNNTTTFYGFVNNSSGTIKTTGAVARYLGGASVGGTYISDPSTQYFTDLSVTPSGALQGGAGDQFIVTGSYSSASTNAANWNTSGALLRLTGGGTHGVTVTGTGGPAFSWGQFQVDAPDTAIVSGSGSAGGFQAIGTTNSGSIQQPSGVSNLGVLAGSGSISVGGGGASAVTSVTSFAQNGVTIADGGRLNVLSNATTFTNTAALLTISGTGTLDIANHRLVTQTPAATVRQYLVSGRANNAWTGNGITSSFVSSNNSGTVKKYALGYAAAGEKNIVPTIPANSVLVRPTLFGDTNLDGTVNNADISAIIAGGKYLDGTTNNSWALGDWNYDGRVDNNDISNLIASGNYLSGQTVNGTTPSAKLTSTTAATPAVTTVGVSGDGIPDYQYDPATGDVKFHTDGQTGVQEVHLRSASSQLQPQNMTDPGVGLNGLDVTSPAEIDLFRQGSSGGTLRQFADGYDFQNILPAGLSLASLLQDLTLSYTTNGGGTSNVPATLIYSGAATPEPTSLALVGVAAAGLLRRKRRR